MTKKRTSKNVAPLRETVQVANSLFALAVFMRRVAQDLEYYGGFDAQAFVHAKELSGAGTMVLEWAEHARKQYDKDKKLGGK